MRRKTLQICFLPDIEPFCLALLRCWKYRACELFSALFEIGTLIATYHRVILKAVVAGRNKKINY